MRTMKRLVAGVGLLMLAGAVVGQPDPGGRAPTTPGISAASAPKKSALEEAIANALKSNPDLRVATAKLDLAEAELSLARLQVTQKVTLAYQKVQTEKAAVDLAQRKLARYQELLKSRAIDTRLVEEAEAALAKAKTSLAAAEQDLKFLQSEVTPATDARKADAFYLNTFYVRNGRIDVTGVTTPTGATDQLRTALQKKLDKVPSEATPVELLDFVKKAAGVNIHADTKAAAWKEKVALDFKEVTVAGLLQFIEDVVPGHRVVVRNYGLLIVPQEKAPERATTLEAFLRAERATPLIPDPIPKTDRSLGAISAEGKVTRVEGNLISISIGSDAGVKRGQSLVVFRFSPEAKYLGRFRVTETAPTQSICQATGRLAGSIKVGDLVRGKLD